MNPTFRTLKIDDDGALRALVVEHVGCLERGLKIKGERLLLGNSVVDLVALDGESRLVLIAISLVADDATMLRMLEAFAWCLDYPEAAGRLCAVDPDRLAVPPRVMFVSERVSDGFLRKAKYLKIPSIDCREFHYLEVDASGLYCDSVDTPSLTALAVSPVVVIAPAPVPAVHGTMPEPVEPVASNVVTGEPVMVEAANSAVDLESGIRATAPSGLGASNPTTETRPWELPTRLRIPRTLSLQWQRILNRAVDAPDPAKIRAIREYLQSEFPGCLLSDHYEHDRTLQMFQVQSHHGELMHVAAVSDDFLDAEAAQDIGRFLDGHGLGRVLRDAGLTTVLVTPSGLHVNNG